VSGVVIQKSIDVLSPGKGVAYCERCNDREIKRRFIARERGSIL